MSAHWCDDAWYGPAVGAGLDPADLAAAGWIDEPDDAVDNTWWTEPLDTSGWVWQPGYNAIVVTTGAFDPFHTGHLDMVVAARDILEANGMRVAGGVVSPSHDAYVSTKRPDAADGAQRVAATAAALRRSGHRWLSVDPLEAVVATASVNFTTVCDRVLTVARRLAPAGCDVGVWYVFGSDNSGFAGAFRCPPAGCGAVMVRRGGYDIAQPPAGPVLVTTHTTRAISSTGVRALMPAA